MRLILLPFLILPAGCTPEAEFSGPAFYADNCSACHGATGEGDGPLADMLSAEPTDLTMLSARNAGVFPRVAVMSAIDGYARGAHFAPEMPEFGAGDLGETIIVETEAGIGTPVPVGLIALADYLETLQE